MLKSEDLENLFYVLPEELREDKIFEQLWNSIIDNSANMPLILTSAIRVNEEIYDRAVEKFPNLEQFLAIADNDTIINFLVLAKSAIWLEIKKDKELYEIKITVKESEYKNRVYIIKRPLETRVETVKVSENNGFYEYYECDVHIYDENGREVKLSLEEREKEKDFIFSGDFYTPLATTRTLRKNFSKYRKQISQYRYSKLMENDKYMDKGAKYCFSDPFRLSLLAEAVIFEEMKELRKIVEDASSGDFLNVNRNRLEPVVANLLNQIGDGEVIATKASLNNFLELMQDKVNLTGLVTNGYIIKKDGELFGLYNVSINLGNVIITGGLANRDEIINFINKSKYNSNNSNLAAFIGESPKR